MSSDCSCGGLPPPSKCYYSVTSNPGGGLSRSRVVTLMEKRTYTFSSLSGSAEVFVVLCPAMPVLDYSRVKLSVRVHALTMTSGQLLRFYAWGVLPSEEDPAQDFVDPTEFLSLDITSTTTAPALVTTRSAYDPDAFLKISLRATQTSAPSTFLATLSACLQLRDF